ncbi:hypothetical protein EA58_13810 [Photobacterium galatheae]|uniref:GGDEF domain-containing protein n=1 Tax=Photobacterium galatheae TaxID=1654360 RepID=A0A066RNZ5_9GAMM|nr:hypothetical protein EA58_13810 [Photobacterium galatheae]
MSKNHKILYHNDGFSRIASGETGEDLRNRDFWRFYATANPYQEYQHLFASVSEGEAIDFAIRSSNQTLNLTVATFLSLPGGDYLVILEDSSKQKERESRLIREAKSDKLTGLLNRKGFDERLASAIEGYKTDSKFKVGVLFIDLDEFKPINDTYGHDAGDLMLISVANRLLSTVEDFETAARIGGDEFVCIFPVCDSIDDLRTKGEAILHAVAQPVETHDESIGKLVVQCSIGGAIFDQDIHSADALLKKADEAMYEAKKSGKNQIYIR